MYLDDFEEYFSQSVLDKAWEDYEKGAVCDLVRHKGGRVVAKVQGKKDYTVTIDTGSEQLVASCTCPDKHGRCRHIAAVLYRLTGEEAHSEQAVFVAAMLQGHSRDELERVLIELSTLDDMVGRYLITRLLPSGASLVRWCRKMIRMPFQRQADAANGWFTDGSGAVQSELVLLGVYYVMDVAEVLCGAAGRFTDGVELCLLLMEELCALAVIIGDEAGEARKALDETFMLLSEVLEGMDACCEDELEKKRIFNRLLKKLSDLSSPTWLDWAPGFMNCLQPIAEDRGRARKYDQCLQALLDADDEKMQGALLRETIALQQRLLRLRDEQSAALGAQAEDEARARVLSLYREKGEDAEESPEDPE